eukprot:snap_masked-scaffold_45-processed-gene-0.55-mRNA-1 protein AED:1.00 eAED:1.00 QI:0/0/0/0/1/1/2/0/92
MNQPRKRIIKVLMEKASTSINLELDELMLVNKQEPSKNKRNKNNKDFQIKVGKVGSLRQDISLSLKNIHSNDFEHVQGSEDTGASAMFQVSS